MRHRGRQSHDDVLGLFLRRHVEQLFDHHGGAVIEIGRTGKVEYDDLVILDVRADHHHELARRRHGEAPAQQDHADTRRVRVGGGSVQAVCEEFPIEDWDGHHAVEFQAFELSAVSHSRRDQSDRHGSQHVDEDREPQRDQHDRQVLAFEAMETGNQAPIDDVPTDLDQDARESGVWDGLDVSA